MLDVSNSTYIAGQSDWPDHRSCDFLYVPRLATMKSLPPIVVEVQQKVDNKFLVRAIRYRMSVVQSYNVLLILIIICVDKVAKQHILETFYSATDLPFLHEAPCNFWARMCLLSKQTLNNLTTGPLLDMLGSKIWSARITKSATV